MKELLLTPFQKFEKIENVSGILLFGATILAMVLANSPLADEFQEFWQFKMGIETEGFDLVKPLILWVNDGLMAIFFFLIGLEIKRELKIGELNTPRKATFPFLAAVGGMAAPVILFFVLNDNPLTRDGWGIPMATDIAFSLAVLRLLKDRIPLSLKVFLTAFAIVDDLGAVIVIAIFYSANIKWMLLVYAFLMLGILYFLAYKEIYAKYLIFSAGVVIWYLFLKAGIHPTLAGVFLAFAIPIRQKIDVQTYTDKLANIVKRIDQAKDLKAPILSKKQIEEIDNLQDWTSKVQSPLQHLEHNLHYWVSYLIMPIFALANAGVAFSLDMNLDTNLVFTIALCLVLGNLIGIYTMSWLGIRLQLAELPQGMNYRHLLGVSIMAGVGFTMSIFIANLAFPEGSVYLDSAKIGVLLGSTLAAIGGYLILRFAVPQNQAAPTTDDAPTETGVEPEPVAIP
jgi:NhaA family Na+:H+ antiporter